MGLKGSLALEFEDMAAFARSPPAFALGCTRSDGSGVPNLLEASGAPW